MDLQNIFYIVGIISMTLYTVLLIAVVVLLFYIKKKISDLYDNVEDKISTVKTMMDNPREMAATVGAGIVDTAINQIAKMTKSRSKKREHSS